MTDASPSPRSSTIATLLVSCPDRPGLVATLAQVLYGHGANIVHADQHTDPVSGDFFQRIRFDVSDLRTDRVSLEQGLGEVAARHEMRHQLVYGDHKKRVAVFVSKYDHCLYDVLLRQRAHELPCEISCVVSNHPDLAVVAEHFDVPYHHVPITKETKAEREAEEIELLDSYGVDLVVLGRYMQILSQDFCARYEQRIINIHHSFLPAFVGGKPYHQAYERGVKIVGATAHYVTPDLDEGPIIAQDVIHTSHRDSVEDLVRKGRDLERIVLSRAVRFHLEDRILVYGNKTVVFD